MFNRNIANDLLEAIEVFPVTVLTGPRQSGKTTILKYLLPNYLYISLESPDKLLRVKEDPRGFLEQYHTGIIIDEAQNFPELFSYIQEIVDSNKNSHIVLSGSQNFLMAEKISQTLAGRAAIFELLPLTYNEYISNNAINKIHNIWQYLYNGSYPRPYQEHLPVALWYDSYIKTYLERDVRSLINIKDLSLFQLFLKLCAGQHGQEFNAQAIANNIGMSQTTVMNWLSILEASYIVYRLKPYYNNYKKRLSKRSKLYFYDSAIVCHLLGVDSPEHLEIHSARGAIFEGFVISEILKLQTITKQKSQCFYWREHNGQEVDLLIEKGSNLLAIEIKASSTIAEHFTKGLKHLLKIMIGIKNNSNINCAPYIIYAANENLTLGDIKILSWQHISDLSF